MTVRGSPYRSSPKKNNEDQDQKFQLQTEYN
jgi:hypothetical protein